MLALVRVHLLLQRASAKSITTQTACRLEDVGTDPVLSHRVVLADVIWQHGGWVIDRPAEASTYENSVCVWACARVLVISSLAAEKMNRLECMGGKSETQAFAYSVDITTYWCICSARSHDVWSKRSVCKQRYMHGSIIISQACYVQVSLTDQ